VIAEGTVIDGRYRVLSKIGAGGMADVYCAEDTHLGRKVALKLLHTRFAQDREFVERFRREASSAAGLQHPNVVGVYDRGEFDGTYYIAMEYCEGPTLKEIVSRTAPLDPERAIAIAKQMLVAARFAHRRNVIHRDLKPHNVILDSEDNVKVTDFGIARAGASDITEVGAIMGTAQYLSPEQAQGRSVTESSDLYSIGVVLFEMLTGRAPFDGDSAVAVALKHVNQPPPSPRERVPELPPELEAVVLKALAKDPEQRYRDADSFIKDLELVEARLREGPVDVESTAVFAPLGTTTAPTALAPAPPVAAEPPPPAPPVVGEVPPPPPAVGAPPGEPPERRRRWLAAGLIGALALLGLIAFLVFGSKSQVTVPPVVGQTLEQARARVDRAGLNVEIKRRTDPAPRNFVFEQSPNPGQRVDEGSVVTLFVSNGPSTVRVPDVVGLDQTDARRRLRSADLRVEVERESSTKIPEGTVIRTDPGPGRPAERDSAVTLVVSSGPSQVTVPSVVGETQEDAVARLREEGLSPIVRERASSEPVDTVVDQTPASGQEVEEGSSVTIFVSNGKVREVPDVTGLTQSDAEAELKDAGFGVNVRTRETDQPDEVGTVLSQSPRGGVKRREGATVTIAVGQQPAAPPAEGTP
jgi:serine/threonine-protein kinase